MNTDDMYYEDEDAVQMNEDSNDLDEVAPDQEYRLVEETEIDFLLEGQTLYKHQKQMITKMLEAESEAPIESDKGIFYSRIGVNACKPGAGKTAATLAVLIGQPEVEPPQTCMMQYSSPLVSMALALDDSREYIPTSIIICPNTLINSAWKADCDKFYGSDKYYIIGTNAENAKAATKEGIRVESKGNDLATIKKEITSVKQKIGRLTKPGAKSRSGQTREELQSLLEELEAEQNELMGATGGRKVNRMGAAAAANDDGSIEFLVNKMRNHPVIICPASSFYTLVPVFKKKEVSRLVIDELQAITLTHQDHMIGYKTNDIIEFLCRVGRNNSSYRELSPARFIWLITATPDQLQEREKGHFFNSWIARNAPFLRDYSNSRTGHYMFPEMIERYIVKFPVSYINEIIFGGKQYNVDVNIKVSRNRALAVLGGVMGDDFDELLQNDQYDEIMKKLNIECVSINDPDAEMIIIEGAIDALNKQLDAIDHKEAGYKEGNKARFIEENNKERERIRHKIANINRKLEALKSVQELVEGGEGPTCEVCMETFDDAEIMACPECWACYHKNCILSWFKRNGANKTCPKCRKQFTSVADLCVVKLESHSDEEGNDEVKIDFVHEEPETEDDAPIRYESKAEAIVDIVCSEDGPHKSLLYLNSLDDSDADNSTIRSLIDRKVYVFYDKAMTVEKKVNTFGPNAEKYLFCIANRKKISESIRLFEGAKNKCVFIMKTGTQSTGLNFPTVDAIITYSRFNPNVEAQIKGRAERASRTKEYLYIVLEYED